MKKCSYSLHVEAEFCGRFRGTFFSLDLDSYRYVLSLGQPGVRYQFASPLSEIQYGRVRPTTAFHADNLLSDRCRFSLIIQRNDLHLSVFSHNELEMRRHGTEHAPAIGTGLAVVMMPRMGNSGGEYQNQGGKSRKEDCLHGGFSKSQRPKCSGILEKKTAKREGLDGGYSERRRCPLLLEIERALLRRERPPARPFADGDPWIGRRGRFEFEAFQLQHPGGTVEGLNDDSVVPGELQHSKEQKFLRVVVEKGELVREKGKGRCLREGVATLLVGGVHIEEGKQAVSFDDGFDFTLFAVHRFPDVGDAYAEQVDG